MERVGVLGKHAVSAESATGVNDEGQILHPTIGDRGETPGPGSDPMVDVVVANHLSRAAAVNPLRGEG